MSCEQQQQSQEKELRQTCLLTDRESVEASPFLRQTHRLVESFEMSFMQTVRLPGLSFAHLRDGAWVALNVRRERRHVAPPLLAGDQESCRQSVVLLVLRILLESES